jgi:hypothetical protein
MKNAIVLALLRIRMASEQIVKEALCQEEGKRPEAMVRGSWYLALTSAG